MRRFITILLITFVCALFTNCNKRYNRDDGKYRSSRTVFRNYRQQCRNSEIAKQNYEKQRRTELELSNRQNVPITTVNTNRVYRNRYAELWDDCEELSSLLDDNGIDHDEMSYPMDYYELEDLKSEYESLLEENCIEY